MKSETKPAKPEYTMPKPQNFFGQTLIRGLLAPSKRKQEKGKPRHE